MTLIMIILLLLLLLLLQLLIILTLLAYKYYLCGVLHGRGSLVHPVLLRRSHAG